MTHPAKTLQQALSAYQSGDLAQTERLGQLALRQAPENPDALNLLGLVAAHTERHDQAEDFFTRALRVTPGNAALHGHLGIVLRSQGRLDDAVRSFDRAIALNPNSAATFNNRGSTLTDLKRNAEAIESFKRAIQLAPDYAEAWYNLANAQSALHELDAAVASLRKAIAIDPQFVDAHNNLGVTLAECNQHEEAIACYRRALELEPGFVDAYTNLGVALADLRRYDEAIAAHERAITIDPHNAGAHWNLALCRLLLGDFERGWEGYEWRWQQEDVAKYKRTYPQPQWRGHESLAGKTILLYAEQALGSVMQFCRYATKVADLGATVLLEAPLPLLPLLSGLKGVAQVIPQGAAGSQCAPFDMHCPLTSLPLAFHTNLSNLPADVPYLHSDPARVAVWRQRLGEKTKPRIGIMWSGNALPDPRRSMALHDALTLVCDWADCVSLQKEVRASDAALLAAHPEIRHFGDALTDFADTAALVELMDLTISIDTSIAHLAGAMGKPVWILLPYNPDWRWMTDRDDSPWYPTAKLFRQSAGGEWADVVRRVRQALHVHFGR